MKFDDKANKIKERRKTRVTRKKNLYKYKKNSGNKLLSTLLKFTLIAFFVITGILLINGKKKYWDGKSKLDIVINTSTGETNIVSLDPVRSEINTIAIPANTQTDVARGLGNWKIKSVWKLGEEEGLGGQLVAETITRHLKMPVYVWVGKGAGGLLSKDPISVLKAIFIPYESNLGLGDKFSIVLFNYSVKETNRRTLELEDTSYLKEQILSDGSKGYVVSAKIPPEIMAIFSDEEISKLSLNVVITNASSSNNTAISLGEIVEVLGAKVAAINREDINNTDCEVYGDNLLSKKLIQLLNCIKKEKSLSSAFDVNVVIGEAFTKRF